MSDPSMRIWDRLENHWEGLSRLFQLVVFFLYNFVFQKPPFMRVVCGVLPVEWAQAKGVLEARVGTEVDVQSAVCFWSSVMHLYLCLWRAYLLFIFVPSSPSQAADFDMCSIVWSWVCHLCLHLLCGLLFEVSLVASSSWLCHHPICHLDGAHCYKRCSPIYTIM